ncbi:filamentous hemagglutinin N-terminal domain-containing protein [Azoarcus sp. TTM-91]|uniref:two-partner secretion domain-containing protein n=1 Tax=Azoarcus sp. TTM-91 TaxID=2691581 RepID=UPI00145C65E7
MNLRTPFARVLAWTLMTTLALNPLGPAMAQISVASGATTMGQAGNGVPVVNIVAPNERGLSHNRFNDYNVGTQGLILNNANGAYQSTQLGGYIVGNPNLQGKEAARLILNEVTGGRPSSLAGYTEIAGQAARLVVANPWGISCNGCGFLNTPRVTLSTGTPRIEDGRLAGFRVDGGEIAIDGAGLNASNIDQFDLITRSAKINAELYAQRLNIIAGRNDVAADDLSATALAADGAAPLLAIDSAALGGMYANSIMLLGTEAGVGVRLAGDLAASAGDIRIDSAGRLTLNRAVAARDVALAAKDVTLGQAVHAGGAAEVTAENRLAVEGELLAGGAMALAAREIDNAGRVQSGGALAVSAESTTNHGRMHALDKLELVGGAVDNRGGELLAGGEMRIEVASLDNRDGGLLASVGGLWLNTVDDLSNGGGLVSAGGSLVASFDRWHNDGGEVYAGAGMKLTGAELSNQGGVFAAVGLLELDLTQSLFNHGGQLAGGELRLTAGDIDNTGGVLASDTAAGITAISLDNSASGSVVSGGALSLSLSGLLDNHSDGVVYSRGETLELQAAELDNQSGVVQSDGKAAMVLAGQLNNAEGSVIAAGDLDIQAAEVSNGLGTIASTDGALSLELAGQMDNAGGVLQGQRLTVSAGGLLDNNAGRMAALAGPLHLETASLLNRAGSVYAAGDLDAVLGSLDNRGGTLGAANIGIDAGASLDNREGLIESSGDLVLSADAIDNGHGALRAVGSHDATEIVAATMDNRGGKVESANKALRVATASLQNENGSFVHAGDGDFQVTSQTAAGVGGSFASGGTLALSADEWTNSSVLQAGKLILNIGKLTLTADGALIATESFEGNGDDWHNDGLLASDGLFSLTLTGTYSGAGRLATGGNLELNAAAVQLGSTAVVAAGGDATVEVAGSLSNQGRLTAGGDLALRAGSVDNRGTLGSAGDLELRASAISNSYGLIFSGGDMSLRFASLENRYADIYSLGALGLAGMADGSSATLVDNASSSIEAAGVLTMATQSLVNRKSAFAMTSEQVAGSMWWVCYDCGGDHHNVDYVAAETFESRIVEDSPAALIQGGAGLTITANTVENRYSTIASGAGLSIQAGSLANIGAATGTTVRTRTWNSGWVTDGTNESFIGAYIHPYNAASLPKEVPIAPYFADKLVSDITVTTPSGVAASAVIQAAGSATVEVAGSLLNDVAVPGAVSGSSHSADTSVGNSAAVAIVTLNAQLPPDLSQQRVDPLALPGFNLPVGENGLFHWADGNDGALALPVPAGTPASSHRYLIETNPALTSLSSFLSSDYLLGLLGYDTDDAQRRLGDGFYEQKLIQQAVLARTGQRYLDGLNSDEATFRYLMDNAVASKDALQLSVGVSLTAEQVAALTHDIVWMEEQEVAGEKVLVPVLYLAQGEGRLAPTGALIQGRELTLITGGTLANSGTLRATENLSAAATTVVNAGLMQAGERLSVLAADSLVNTRGGILSGRNVDLTTLAGDLINERTVTSYAGSGAGFAISGSLVDAASRIEAAQSLSLSAGQDLLNLGSVLSAGTDMQLSAGRDLLITSVEEINSRFTQDKRHTWSTASTTQLGAEVSAGGSLTAVAGNDLAVIASRVQAGGDVALLAGNDLTLAAAADVSQSEYHYKSSRKKINAETLTVRQQAAEVEAGGSLTLAAGQDLTLVASAAQAGDEAYLYAGRDLELLAAENQDYFLYDKKKKGSLGRKRPSATRSPPSPRWAAASKPAAISPWKAEKTSATRSPS